MKCKLGNVMSIKHGFPFKGEYFSDNGKYIILTPANFFEEGGFKYTPGKEKYYISSFPDEYVCKKDDLIVVMTQQAEGLLGSTAFVPEDNKYLHNQRIGLINTIKDKLLPEYAYFLFRTKDVREQIRNTASGSKVKHTSPEKICDVIVDLPDIETQKAISNVLFSLEKKDNINHHVCADLEGMAKLLYDYWFVQFDFPDENGKPYKSSGGKMVWNEDLKREIPEGWEVKRLEGMYVIERGITYTSDDISSDAGVPMINLACVDRSRNYRDGELKYFNGKISNDAYLRGGDLLIACTDLTREREIIGCPILVPDDSIRYTYSMDMAKISFSSSTVNELYMYMALRTDYYHNFIKAWASGTNVLHLNLKGLDWYTMCIPPKPLQDRFADIIHDIHSKKSKVLVENQLLASLRDFLLPMLMNGQVKVSPN